MNVAAAPPKPWLHLQCDVRLPHGKLTYDVSLSCAWTAIFGPSGSGKTTLLRLLAGLEPQVNGTCMLHGRELRRLPAHERRVAWVDQSASVFPHLSVRENVAFSPRRPSRKECLEPLIERCHLAHIADAPGGQISGGEAQRVVLARALASEPDLLLLDESFSGLDRELRAELRLLLVHTQQARAQQGRPMPVLSVTHDVGEVFVTAGEVLRMQRGLVVHQGSPTLVLNKERLALQRDLGFDA